MISAFREVSFELILFLFFYVQRDPAKGNKRQQKKAKQIISLQKGHYPKHWGKNVISMYRVITLTTSVDQVMNLRV